MLTITTTHTPADDLGYLLHEHPHRCRTFDPAFGKAHAFYPRVDPHPCTAALLLDVDPIGLVRNRRGPSGDGFLLQQCVNDRPYVASSLMSVAIARVLGSLMYRDERLTGFDAAAVVEVIEHLDAPRLAAFERVVFECARPQTVIVTTPNIEYHVRFGTLAAGKLRHKDHRFEWTREEFRQWAGVVADRFEYSVRFSSVGPADAEIGSPTQMGVLSRSG